MAIVDHSFHIKGVGTVVTGTCIQGSCKLGESVVLDSEKVKIKGMQSFKKPIHICKAGYRVGFNVSGVSPKLLSSERTLMYSPGGIQFSKRVLCNNLCQVPFYREEVIFTFKRLHISIMNKTILSKNIVYFKSNGFSFSQEDKFTDESLALIEFEEPVPVLQGSKFMGSRLDLECSSCRLAIYGNLLGPAPDAIKVYRERQKVLQFDRWYKPGELIAKGLTKAQVERHSRDTVLIILGDESSITGSLIGPFGSSDKVLVHLQILSSIRIEKIVLIYKKDFLVYSKFSSL